ncbi:MAG: putative ABC transporter permease, partial [Eggerthellaceae bacterium]|nr:putative ABC transporter permease [Eggerthellaceae bacterium]
VASVLGLLFENTFHELYYHGYQNRVGLLFGPFSPIYGLGAVLMTLALNRLHSGSVLVIFFASAVIGGTFEYLTSWFMELAFGVTAWDYTGMWLSIGGRTCGLYMAVWGVLGVLWVKLLLPLVLRVVNLIPWKWRYAITGVCALLMLVDVVMTLQALDCWYERVSGTSPHSGIQRFYAAHFDDAYMQHRFQSMLIQPGSAARG